MPEAKCVRAYASPCICTCVWGPCNLVVWCSASSRCQSKLAVLQCAHPALPGPHQLSPTDGSNHLPRCLSLPAFSSSLSLCNRLLSKINSLPGSFSSSSATSSFFFSYFSLFADISPFLCHWIQFSLLNVVAGLCALLPEKLCGFWLSAGIVGGSKIQRLLKENMSVCWWWVHDYHADPFSFELVKLWFCLSIWSLDVTLPEFTFLHTLVRLDFADRSHVCSINKCTNVEQSVLHSIIIFLWSRSTGSTQPNSDFKSTGFTSPLQLQSSRIMLEEQE